MSSERIAVLEQRIAQVDETLNQLKTIRTKLEGLKQSGESQLPRKQLDAMLTLNGDAIAATERLRMDVDLEIKAIRAEAEN